MYFKRKKQVIDFVCSLCCQIIFLDLPENIPQNCTFVRLQFCTKTKAYQSLKDEYSSSPFRSQSGTSIDPYFDPDSIAHANEDSLVQFKSVRHKKAKWAQSAIKASNQSELDTFETSDDIEEHFDESDMFSDYTQNENELFSFQSKQKISNPHEMNNDFDDDMHLQSIKTAHGWKKRALKLAKYKENIIDPLERPIIRKKRIFNKGDKCEGCGVLLQNQNPEEMGFVHSIQETDASPDETAETVEGSIDGNMEMKDVYIPDHQRLILMDLGLIEKNQKYLKYDQYVAITEGNKKANVYKLGFYKKCTHK